MLNKLSKYLLLKLKVESSWTRNARAVAECVFALVCWLQSLFTNFAAGHITGTSACVQTTCIIMSRRSPAPNTMLIRWQLSTRLSVTSQSQWESRGRALMNHNSHVQVQESTFLSTHGSTCKTEQARGSRPGPTVSPTPSNDLIKYCIKKVTAQSSGKSISC